MTSPTAAAPPPPLQSLTPSQHCHHHQDIIAAVMVTSSSPCPSSALSLDYITTILVATPNTAIITMTSSCLAIVSPLSTLPLPPPDHCQQHHHTIISPSTPDITLLVTITTARPSSLQAVPLHHLCLLKSPLLAHAVFTTERTLSPFLLCSTILPIQMCTVLFRSQATLHRLPLNAPQESPRQPAL